MTKTYKTTNSATKKKSHHPTKIPLRGWVGEMGMLQEVCSFHWILWASWRFGIFGGSTHFFTPPPRLLWSIGSIWQPGWFSGEGQYYSMYKAHQIPSPKLTAKAPENGWLFQMILSFWCPRPIFRGQLLVLGRVTNFKVLFGEVT